MSDRESKRTQQRHGRQVGPKGAGPSLSRRSFLQATAASALLPTIFVPRAARAQQAVRARQLLIIYCQGGIRSHSLFTFDTPPLAVSPFGTRNSPIDTKSQFVLASPQPRDSSLQAPFVRSESLPEWGRDIGNIYTIRDQFSVITPIDHNPGGPAELDANVIRNLITSGRRTPGPGLLTIIGNRLTDPRPLPPFVIGDEAAAFATSAPGFESGAPVFIRDPLDIATVQALHPTQGKLSDWEGQFQASEATRLATSTPTLLGQPINQVRQGFGEVERVRAVLALPQLQFRTSANANAFYETSNGFNLTNKRIEQALLPFIQFPTGGNTANSDFSDPLGVKAALALRLLQYGSPAVAIGYGGFDLHKDEKGKLYKLTRPLGRVLSALSFILAGMKGETTARRLDEVLIMVVSDSGRDNVRAETGFNEFNGSDHRGTNASRFQVLPAMGAGVRGGRIVGGVTADANLAPTGKVFASAQLAATMLSSLGIAHRTFVDADPIDELFT